MRGRQYRRESDYAMDIIGRVHIHNILYMSIVCIINIMCMRMYVCIYNGALGCVNIFSQELLTSNVSISAEFLLWQSQNFIASFLQRGGRRAWSLNPFIGNINIRASLISGKMLCLWSAL